MATDKVQGIYFEDTGIRYMSNTTGYVVDLLCEGEISGLVYQDYKDNGSNSIGTIGYTAGVTTVNYATNPASGELASIYWNKTPIFDKDSQKFNYSSIDLVTSQKTIAEQGLSSRRLVQINEKLRGLERKTGDTIEFVKYYRYYTIRNKYCNKAIINLRVNSLGTLDKNPGTTNQPNETYGQLLDSDVTVNIDYRAKYALGADIQYTHGGKVEVEGSLSSPYARSFELDLPLNTAKDSQGRGDFIGWEIRIYKNKEEPTTPDVRNEVFVDNIIEEIEDTFVYPKTHVVKNTFDAENFSQIPERAYDMRLLKVKIPSNYDPITRTYAGNWDGQFSTESHANGKGKYWTDNPAWCFYDLITNKRYGLGRYVDTSTLDKWTLYEIARYCDELVEDYDNGLEPRFSCNILIQSRSDAYQVLNDMASIFRGIVYYNGGSLFAVQDSLKEPVFQFNNTSVENGEFKYSSTSAKVRHTVAIVRYNDRNNKFEPAVEYVEDIDAIRKYGIKEKEISAFGCTSKSQAQRLGRWILSTEANETETVSFTCGQEGAILRPGDVFSVSDSNRSMTRRGGRIRALERTSDSSFKIAIDSQLKGGKSWDGNKFVTNENLDSKIEYQLTVSTPSFYYDTSQVNLNNSSEINLIRNKQVQTFDISPNTVVYDSASGVSVITVSGNLNETAYTTSGFSGEALWSIATTGVNNNADTFFEKLAQEQEYRVINLSERDKGKYEVSAAEYARVKYAEIDQATKPVNSVNFQVPSSPTSIGPTTIVPTKIDGAPNTKLVTFTIGQSADHDTSVSYYQAYIKKGSYPTESDYDSTVKVYSLNNLTANFIPASNGTYYIRAYAYNSLGESNGSHGSAQNTTTVGGVTPVRDVRITHLSLLDDLLGGAQGDTSDPTAEGDTNIDQFDDSTAQFKWKTSVPQFQGANIAVDFQYKVEVYDDTSLSNNVRTVNNYKPDDAEFSRTTFDYTLANNYEDHGNNYDNISRLISLQVFPVDADGTVAGNDGQGDKLIVENPIPAVPTDLQGFIDLDNHIKVFNLNRAVDVKEIVVLSAPDDFTYDQYRNGTRGDIDVKRISADVDVIEINPSWTTQTAGGETVDAYFMVAYVDQFDLDIEALAIANGDTFDLTKKLNNRFSNSQKIEKVTQDTIDLLGEGWKAWIQIDVDGKWYGRGIKCIEDVTDEYNDYAGYIPYYCTYKAPTYGLQPNGTVFLVGSTWTRTVGITNGNNFTASCGYFWKEDSPFSDYPTNTPTRDISPVGGHTSQSQNFTTTNDTIEGNRTISATKGFKRYRVHFETPKGNPYWVVGHNCNNEPYYSDDFLTNINAFFNPSSTITPSYASDFKAGAMNALAKADSMNEFNNKTLQIGSSDAYFNFHPAGFVQGFGGLPKTSAHFDIHMGHLADKTYLSRGIFFVMATTEETKQQKSAGDPQC